MEKNNIKNVVKPRNNNTTVGKLQQLCGYALVEHSSKSQVVQTIALTLDNNYIRFQEAGFSYDPNATPSDIDIDILFREGVDFLVSNFIHPSSLFHLHDQLFPSNNCQGRTTFTPRLLLLDQKNALKHMPRSGGLYSEQNTVVSGQPVFNEQNVLWEPNKVEVIQEEPQSKPEFQQDLDNHMLPTTNEKTYDFSSSVDTWTDFMYARYHPRSITTLQNVNDANSDEYSFDCFTAGSQLWKDEYLDDVFGDKIRQYIEECNNCQGFQVLFDCMDGYSGIAAKCLEYLSDEYSKTLLTIPIFAPRTPKFKNSDEAMSDSIRVANTALAYNSVIEHSSLVLPLSTMARSWRQNDQPRQFPLFDYQADNFYETSAILATYLDTMSLRYRLRDNPDSCHLAGFCSDLSNYGRKLAAAALALPFKINAGQDLIDCLDQHEGKLFTQLSPNTEIGTDRIVQTAIVRGLNRLKSSNPKIAERQMRMAAYHCNSVSEMFQLYFQCSNYNSLAHVAALEKGMPTMVPYPVKCFDRQITANGLFNEFAMNESEQPTVRSIPVLATAQSASELANTIESLHREAKRIKIDKIHRFKETGFESDDYPDVLDSLLNFKDNYEDNFEL